MQDRLRTTAVCLFAVALLATSAAAQRGGRGGGDDRGRGGFGGFGGFGGGGDFRERILSGMDANGNGYIEPNEMQGRARGLVEQMARDAGLDTNRPLEIRRLVGSGGESRGRGGWGRGRGDDDDDDDDRRRRRGRGRDDDDDDEPENGLYVRLPRFGNEDVVGFGLHPRMLAGRIVDLESEFDERIIQFAERTMDRYDQNENSILDREEWEDVRWRNRDPNAADLDQNGRLTIAEVAHLFTQDRRDRDRGRGRGRDDRRGRDDDDDDDDDDDRRRGSGRFGGFGGGGRGWGGGRGDDDDDDRDDRGRRGGGRGGRGGFGFDPSRILARFDQDGDGTIDPDEVDERQARFFGERFNIDFSEPVAIDDLAERMRGGDRQRRNRGERANEPEVPPAYQVSGEELKGRKSYRSEKASPLPSSLSSRDRNGDGQIDLSEFLRRADDSASAAREFRQQDRNGDGIITPDEASSGNR